MGWHVRHIRKHSRHQCHIVVAVRLRNEHNRFRCGARKPSYQEQCFVESLRPGERCVFQYSIRGHWQHWKRSFLDSALINIVEYISLVACQGVCKDSCGYLMELCARKNN